MLFWTKSSFAQLIHSLLNRGIYYHLTQTWCGVGNLDPAESRRKIDAQNQPAENQQIKPAENQQIKPVESQPIKPVENQ